MAFNEIDQDIAAAKSHWDHADAPYEPDVLALIRAAEVMRRMLSHPGNPEGTHDILVRMTRESVVAMIAIADRLGISQTDAMNRAVQEYAQTLDAAAREADHLENPGRFGLIPNCDRTARI